MPFSFLWACVAGDSQDPDAICPFLDAADGNKVWKALHDQELYFGGLAASGSIVATRQRVEPWCAGWGIDCQKSIEIGSIAKAERRFASTGGGIEEPHVVDEVDDAFIANGHGPVGGCPDRDEDGLAQAIHDRV